MCIRGRGGGIRLWGSDATYDGLTISDCIIENNEADEGGGIHLNASGALLKNLTIRNNKSNRSGGGIFLFNSGVTLEDVTISNNVAREGGGTFSQVSSANWNNVIVKDNSATYGDGGIHISAGGKPTLRNVTVQNNSAKHSGGVRIHGSDTAPKFINVKIIGNKATGDVSNNLGNAAGVNLYQSSPIFENVLIADNVANNTGAAIGGDGGTPVFKNVTIAGNISANHAAFDYNNADPIFINCIIWNNSPQSFSDAQEGFAARIVHSNIEGGWDGEGNIDARPHFIDAANGDYHIGDYSLGIGAGVYSAQFDDTWYYAPSTDLDGNPRPNPAGSMPDMGAYENPRATPQHAPEPFELVFPFDSTHIGITRHNYLDTLYFAWNQAIDPDGDKVTYRRELTGDLQEYIKFIVTSDEETTTNMYKVPYHHIEDYMHTAGVELITGTWTIVANDGKYDVHAENGPFTLTIDGSKLEISDSDIIPETFALYANYPNPFNPTTTISYDLPKRSQVTLGIYDLLGKQIKTLVNQSQDVGNKIAVWDGTDNLGRQVSAGVYLYQIQAGEFSQTRKMLLLK